MTFDSESGVARDDPNGESIGGMAAARTGSVERASRTVTTLLAGRLRYGAGAEALCRVRNLSATGMMVETQARLEVGDPIAVDLRNGGCLEGQVVWAAPPQIGVQFASPRSPEQLLTAVQLAQVRRGKGQPRAPRFDVSCRARLGASGAGLSVVVENISQSGARLRLGTGDLPEDPVLAIPGLTPRWCTIRWRRGDLAGISFAELIAFDALSAWLADCRAGRFGMPDADVPAPGARDPQRARPQRRAGPFPSRFQPD